MRRLGSEGSELLDSTLIHHHRTSPDTRGFMRTIPVRDHVFLDIRHCQMDAIPGMDLGDRGLGQDRKGPGFPAMYMRSMIEQHRMWRLDQVCP